MTQLFSRIRFIEDGLVEFKFSEDAGPLVFELKRNYYSFHLDELGNVKSKYSLILMKLWEAYRLGNREYTTIKGEFRGMARLVLG